MSDTDESLEHLLRRVLTRVEGVAAGEARVRSLLDAVTAVAGTLDLEATLRRIVHAAADLANARYVALGVIDPDGEGLSKFVTFGISDEEIEQIGPYPSGKGVLGLLISDPRPLRLHDITEHPKSYGFPPHHPAMASFLGVPVRVANRVFGNLYLAEKRDGGDFTREDEQAIIALAAAAGVAVENARLFETVRRREQWLAATLEIQQSFMRRVDVDTALRLVTMKAREVLQADVAMVVLEQDDGALEVRALDGEPAGLQGRTLPREGSLADVVDRAATVRLAEGLKMPGLDALASALLVPFTAPGGTGGALLVGTEASGRGRWLADDDVSALRGFAAQAAIALDRAQAQEDREALAVLADRDRIARDLHDVVIQRLFATGLTLQSAERRAGDAEVVERLHSAVADLDSTIRDIRGTIFELSHNDSEIALRKQIRDLATAARDSLRLYPELVLEGPLDSAVPDGVKPDLLAVLLEALTNVARHAHASRVEVRVAVEAMNAEAFLVAEVRDDGKGFATTDHESGLRNMRQRAEARGGSCTVESAPGEGTLVRWLVPLAD